MVTYAEARKAPVDPISRIWDIMGFALSLGLTGLSLVSTPVNPTMSLLSGSFTFAAAERLINPNAWQYPHLESFAEPKGKAGFGVSIYKPTNSMITISVEGSGGDYWDYVASVAAEQEALLYEAERSEIAELRSEYYKTITAKAQFERDILKEQAGSLQAQLDSIYDAAERMNKVGVSVRPTDIVAAQSDSSSHKFRSSRTIRNFPR